MDEADLNAQIRHLEACLDGPMRAAVIDLATDPGEGNEPDAARFGPGTAQYLTEVGVLNDAGFVTDLGVAAGWAFHDANEEADNYDAETPYQTTEVRDAALAT